MNTTGLGSLLLALNILEDITFPVLTMSPGNLSEKM